MEYGVWSMEFLQSFPRCVSRKTSSGVVECWMFCQVSIKLGNRGKCERRPSIMIYRQPNIAEFEVGHLLLHPQ